MRAVLVVGLALALTGAPNRLDTLDVMRAGYPRAYFFRSSEGLAANPKVSYEAWEKSFSRLMGIEGKVLDEEIPERSRRNIEFFTRFKREHPHQLVLLHYNGNARDPRDNHEAFFAGHWLYYNGARITADVPAEAGETEIAVGDPRLFRVNIGRYGNSNEDVGLCALDASGKPDWRISEQVQLVAVDAVRKTIRVRRGAYGTKPLAFAAGKAYAAAHAGEGPWGEKSNLLWAYNHSTACPRDRQGRTADDVLIAEIASWFARGGKLAAFDGIQFDVLKHTPGGGRAGAPRAVDVNSDGAPDAGMVDRINLYGAGTAEFCRRLGAALGPEKLLLADGWSANNVRAFGLLNGIEDEGWPSLTDYQVNDWSGGFNRHGFWNAHRRAPGFSYVNHKYNIAGEKPGADSPKVPYNIHRLVLAASVFLDAAITYSMRPGEDRGMLIGIYDELRQGADNRVGWLGMPRGPARQLAEAHRIKGSFTFQGGRIAGLPAGFPDLVVAFRAKGDPLPGMPHETGREFFTGPSKSLAWMTNREHRYRYYLPDFQGGGLEIAVEGEAPFQVSEIEVFAHPDVMVREFDRGVVLANPGPRPYAFDLAKLFPGRKLRRLRGAASQDPRTNDGSPVGAAVTLGPKDALFLVSEPL